jgi:hypothetical protein
MRWPDEEIGRYSVSPWVMPRTMAWRIDTCIGGQGPHPGRLELRKRTMLTDRDPLPQPTPPGFHFSDR